MPFRALGRLHDFSERICAIQKSLHPKIDRKAVVIMAADHGVVAEGVSAYPQEVTCEMIKAFLSGGAGINVLAGQAGADMIVVDMGIRTDLQPAHLQADSRLHVMKIARGTANMLKGPAMSRQQARQSIMIGFQIASDQIAAGAQLLGTGDMGIGNTTASAAIGAVITAMDPDAMVGPGTGVDNSGLARKCDIVRGAIEMNRPDPADGLDVLAKVGGFEIGGIAGCILAGAYHRCPVVIDGFISTAGALVAERICTKVKDYLFAGHCSAEPGHHHMLAHLKLEPILNLGMRLGEGTGAALAMHILAGAVNIFNQMFTFEQAGVSGQNP
jgi:nicotinate-nucleotide--dimethylbenzimidazole phosphoribosyltransferase